MTYGYIRVSTDKQTVENQRFEITRFCKTKNIHIDGRIEETISGTKPTTNEPSADCSNRCRKTTSSSAPNYHDLGVTSS